MFSRRTRQAECSRQMLHTVCTCNHHVICASRCYTQSAHAVTTVTMWPVLLFVPLLQLRALSQQELLCASSHTSTAVHRRAVLPLKWNSFHCFYFLPFSNLQPYFFPNINIKSFTLKCFKYLFNFMLCVFARAHACASHVSRSPQRTEEVSDAQEQQFDSCEPPCGC